VVEKKSVSVNWQTLFAIIPIIDLWACYRIEKLRMYLLVIIAILVVEFLGGFLIFGDSYLDSYLGEVSAEDIDDYGYGFATLLIEIGISIVLIRMWSKEWNSKIAENS